MQGIKSEHEYKGDSVRCVGYEINREGGMGQFYPQCVVRWGEVWKISLNNFICHKLGILSLLLTNYCQLLSG